MSAIARGTIVLVAAFALTLGSLGCHRPPASGRTVLTVSGSALGAEGAVLTRQLGRFMRLNPDIEVRLQRTPDDATQRHQLYVQWLNARVGDPDILGLDVVWTAEFAAAGWILPLGRYHPATADFFPATIAATMWRGEPHALPWFVDVGLLYRRTDIVPREPASLDEMVSIARTASGAPGGPRYGIVWQGARYEGLVTGFLEYLGGFGGRIVDDEGRAVVDSPEALRALTFMRAQLTDRVAPLEVLTWHEEESRFAFQNGEAVFMRNWPYPFRELSDRKQSRVAGKFAVGPMPGASGGRPTTALGGQQLAVNAYTDHPDAAYALIAFLTAPAQMLERAEVVGQFPTRPALFDDPRLAAAIDVPLAEMRRAIESATPRPVTPIYTELSDLLQIQLHRALSGQTEPARALRTAARQMNELLERTGVRRLMAERGADRGATEAGTSSGAPR